MKSTNKLTLLAATAAIAFAPLAVHAAQNEAAGGADATYGADVQASPGAPAATSEPMGTMDGVAADATANASTLVRIEQPDATVTALNRTVSDVEGMTVVGADEETIGEVGAVIGRSDGTPTALTVEAGGFLGIGERTVAIQIDQFAMLDDDRLTLAMTKDQIEQMPEWTAPTLAE